MGKIATGCLAGLLLISVSTASAQQGSGTKIGEKTFDEWRVILKTHQKAEARQYVVLVMELFGPGETGVVTALIDTLHEDKNGEVRTTAAQVLAKIGPKATEGDAIRAAKALKVALKDKDAEVRRAVAKGLGGKMSEFGKEAIPALADALKDKDQGTRSAAAAALRDYGKEALQVMPKLLEAVQDSQLDHYTRVYTLQILTKHSKDAAKIVPVLTTVLAEKEAHTSLKQAAADGLGNFPRDAQPATDKLVELFQDEQFPTLLRQSAALTLAKIQADSKKVWPAAKKVMQGEDALLRTQAIRLAAKVCRTEPELIPALIERCEDDHVDAQIAAIQELGEFGPRAQEAEKTLKRLSATASRSTVREAAADALKKLQGKTE